jgi:hypothetical protein
VYEADNGVYNKGNIQQLIAPYNGQGSVERGFRFLKDPLFLVILHLLGPPYTKIYNPSIRNCRMWDREDEVRKLPV